VTPDPTEEIVEHLFGLVDRLRVGFETTAADFDLSVAQAKALRHLAQVGPVPMRELACRLRCDASNVTGIIDRLERRGLVERRASPSDRRIKSLVTTRQGDEVARALWIEVRASALALLDLSDDERATLVALLRRADPAALRVP
jgi:MarR family transcriptional regulator, organic hydroperoxide resistance regulator